MNVSSWNVSTFAAITVVLLDFYVGARYCTKLIRKEISPRIATWLIFEIGVVMSLASYLAGNDRSLIKVNIYLTNQESRWMMGVCGVKFSHFAFGWLI